MSHLTLEITNQANVRSFICAIHLPPLRDHLEVIPDPEHRVTAISTDNWDCETKMIKHKPRMSLSLLETGHTVPTSWGGLVLLPF